MPASNHMKEGFLAGGGLLLVGLMLQLIIGPIEWSLFAWPVDIILLLLLCGFIGLMYALRKKVYAFEWMMHYGAAVPSLVYALALTVVMGLTAQVEDGGIPGLSQMLSFWPFVLAWTWMMVISGLAALNHLMHFSLKEIPFIVNHLGVFVAVVCATLGSADRHEATMTVFVGSTERMAQDEGNKIVEPGIAIELHEFIMETYDNGYPKRFASDISVYTQDGKDIRGTVDVNKPIKVNGWKIYQYGYDSKAGAASEYSQFLMVKDPWIFWVYLGIYMMLAGALCLMVFMAPKPVKS